MGSCAGGGGGGGLGGRLDSLAPNGPAMESALQAPSAARAARAKNRIDRDVARRMGGNLRNGLVATFRGLLTVPDERPPRMSPRSKVAQERLARVKIAVALHAPMHANSEERNAAKMDLLLDRDGQRVHHRCQTSRRSDDA